LSTTNGIDKRNNNIKQSFEAVYDTIFDGADRILRNMRRTFEVKQRFWEGAIEDFADSDNIDTKKDLYAMKRDA
jgi:hypothetical protein